jgi:hypothetical protein
LVRCQALSQILPKQMRIILPSMIQMELGVHQTHEPYLHRCYQHKATKGLHRINISDGCLMIRIFKFFTKNNRESLTLYLLLFYEKRNFVVLFLIRSLLIMSSLRNIYKKNKYIPHTTGKHIIIEKHKKKQLTITINKSDHCMRLLFF